MYEFSVHDCNKEQNRSRYFSSIVRLCNWPSQSQERLLRSRNFASLVTWRHTSLSGEHRLTRTIEDVLSQTICETIVWNWKYISQMLRYVNCGLSVESIRLSISRFVIKWCNQQSKPPKATTAPKICIGNHMRPSTINCINCTRVFKIFQNCPSREATRAIWKILKTQEQLILISTRSHGITCLSIKGKIYTKENHARSLFLSGKPV